MMSQEVYLRALAEANRQEPDHARVLADLEEARSLQNVDAIRALSKLYEVGNVVNIDYSRSVSLLHEGHDLGDVNSTLALSDAYRQGRLVTRDCNRALALLESAIERQDGRAMVNYAYLLETGECETKINVRGAFLLYVDAFLHGSDYAVYEIARCVKYGIGVKRDEVQAELWYDRSVELGADRDTGFADTNSAISESGASKLGHSHSKWSLADLTTPSFEPATGAGRNPVLSDLAPSDRDHFLAVLHEVLRRNQAAMREVGWCLNTGRGVGKDREQAQLWLYTTIS